MVQSLAVELAGCFVHCFVVQTTHCLTEQMVQCLAVELAGCFVIQTTQ